MNMMLRKYRLLLLIVIFVLSGTSCSPQVTENASSVQPESTSLESDHIQSGSESQEDFVARIVSEEVTSSRPLLIAFSQMESKENLWFGVSPNKNDIQKCWIYEVDSTRICTKEDIENNLRDQKSPKIFFAFAYSDSLQELFIVDYYHPWIEQDIMDGYRLVIEFKNGKWIEKSITTVY